LKKPYSVLIIGLLFLAAGCQQGRNTGILEGKITIGPLCPAETSPEDPRCAANEDTYRQWPIAVWTGGKTTKKGEITANSAGEYRVQIPEGEYIIDFAEMKSIGSSNLPAMINIKRGQTVELDINIDTGMR
jgi:hypothetical protein